SRSKAWASSLLSTMRYAALVFIALIIPSSPQPTRHLALETAGRSRKCLFRDETSIVRVFQVAVIEHGNQEHQDGGLVIVNLRFRDRFSALAFPYLLFLRTGGSNVDLGLPIPNRIAVFVPQTQQFTVKGGSAQPILCDEIAFSVDRRNRTAIYLGDIDGHV